jgi:hypothetical protein
MLSQGLWFLVAVITTVAGQLLALGVWAKNRKRLASGILAIGTLPLVLLASVHMVQHARLGEDLGNRNRVALDIGVSILVLSLLSMYRFPRVLFWSGWGFNLLWIGVLIYSAQNYDFSLFE